MKKLLLLLIGAIIIFVLGALYFLVTVDIEEDKEVNVIVPTWHEKTETNGIKSRNLLTITVDKTKRVIFREQEIGINEVKPFVIHFVTNPNQEINLAESPAEAHILLKKTKGTDYKNYLAVYNEIKAAYNELWEEESQKQFNKPYSEELPIVERRAIKAVIPFSLIDQGDSDDQ